MMGIAMFTEEERHVLNSVAQGRHGAKRREEIVGSLVFSRQVTDDNEHMMLALFDGLIEKMTSLTDNEWQEMSRFLPFPTMVSMEDMDAIKGLDEED